MVLQKNDENSIDGSCQQFGIFYFIIRFTFYKSREALEAEGQVRRPFGWIEWKIVGTPNLGRVNIVVIWETS